MPQGAWMKPFLSPRAALTLAALAATATPIRAQQTYELSGDPAAIWNLAGAVTVTGGGTALTVEVRRMGADAERLEVATGPVDLDRDGVGRVNGLRVLYPDDRISYAGGDAELWVRDDGTFFRGRDGGRRVRIRESGDGIDAHADLTIRVPAGRSVHVYLAAGEVTVSNVDGELEVGAASADIRTSGTSGSLVLDTGSGDIEIDGARGDISLDTGSGDVDARNVSAGEIWIDTGSGDVEGEQLTATELGVDTGSGDVVLSGVEAPEIMVDTGSGEVALGLLGARDLSVDTGSGDVTLTLPADWQGEVELDTASGDIHSDFRMTVEEMDEDYVRGRIGSGGGSLTVDTGSGDIRLVQG